LALFSPFSGHEKIINQFIQLVLIDATAFGNVMIIGSFELQWTFNNDPSLVFLVQTSMK